MDQASPWSQAPRARDVVVVAAIFVLEGAADMRHGPNLEHLMRVEAGDFIYIPAGVPHQPFNSTDAPVRAVLARTDPNEQESVVVIDEPQTA